MNEYDLSGKVALVTGASRGIGRSIAIKLGNMGARVAVNYNRGETEANDLVSVIPHSLAFQADVADRNQVNRMAGEIHSKMGKVDIVVNNAGYWELMDFTSYREEAMDRMFAVNVKGCINTVIAFMGDLKGSGIVVNIASNAGIGTAAPNTTLYSLTKAAVIMLTKRLAFDLREHHIRVNAVAPGWVETDMTVGNRSSTEVADLEQYFRNRTTLNMIGKPEDIADVVAFLASDESRYINGQVIVADGGRMDNLTHGI
ncbi:MAG: SDR family oxidoreductase [Thermoplasmataceae archaeon]